MFYWGSLENNMNHKNSVSAIVIARNEAVRLPTCLKSLSWTDELIVVDNGSTDTTAEIAKKYHALVVSAKTDEFSALRDAGAKRAQGKWLLYVDADETVSTNLAAEIKTVIRDSKAAAYFIPRDNFYMGHRWPYRDGMIRLIRRDALVRWEGKLHEHAVINGSVGTLSNSFIHMTHRTLEEMVAKTNEWSDVEAKLRFEANHPHVTWWRLFRVMITGFIDSFFRQGGWKAGVVGWIESMYQAFSMFITYAKLWELQQKK